MNPLTCSFCHDQNYGTQKAPGTKLCADCEQWVKRPSLLSRLVRAVKGA